MTDRGQLVSGASSRLARWCPMTLAEFLLARLDEEEAAVLTLFDDVRPGIGSLGDPFGATRATVLADLAAKRRLVASAKRDEEWDEAAGFEPVGRSAALTQMALRYSAHEDYRDAWRPASQ